MLKEMAIYTTEIDRERLGHLIDRVRDQDNKADFSYINDLEEKLEFAETVASEQIPPDVVTMGSQVRLRDLDTGNIQIYSIVFPSEANSDERKISILAPIATALLGNKSGDIVEVKAPYRIRKLRIEEILYQPESASIFS